ncbi:filamentous hemagglutinin N-terminal domain-containing protein [Zoogloeaceae bacterium G21618-S1]|nr:filamentous hemagglutinin N-terminal domain-containing protein [Zoogloeaceae bacterium G21618-S1]
MKSRGLNHFYRVVWNAAKFVWQAVSEAGARQGKGRVGKAARSLRRAAAAGLAACGVLLLMPGAHAVPGASELPTGGAVVDGSATIAASGARLDITQTTTRAAIDWASFNIGSQAHVHFAQPAGGATLNRVLDTNASQIYGRLTSTGQVFLVNPQGVYFAPGAQVDVGGLVASTLNLGNADFMAGNYAFAGSSSNAIINQANITVAPGGTIALIAARIINDGTLTATGGNVLLGAGDRVTLDMGGPVKLQVANDTVETLIQNGGAIRADGGHVLLTSQAAATLASSVINNTGVIEAQALGTGAKGEIILFAHGGEARVGGSLKAEGGFIETSGKTFSIADGAVIEAGQWLIDPVNITIGSALATTIAGALTVGSVTISTDGGNTPDTTSGQSGTDGDITVNSGIAWGANKLTLNAARNINVNATLDATGSGSLAFEYGQGSADGAGSAYSVGSGAKIYIPTATAFTWKKGSGGAVRNLVFDNGNLRFGNGTQASLNTNGLLEQPWYFDNTSEIGGVTRNAWYKLTFSNFALNMEVGAGGDGSSSWNRNGALLDSQTNLAGAISGRRFDISGYQEGGGVIVSSVTLAFGGGESVKVDNTYTLAAGSSFVKIDTALTNVGGGAASNLRLWVGTQDDYVATRDSQFKYKGNLTENGFELITAQTDQAKALKVTEFDNGEGAAILFYSTSDGADTSISNCCSFTNATGIDPRTSSIWRGPEDGSYALFIRLADLATGQADGMTWYYAAAPANQINSVVTQVAQSAGVAPVPASAPAPSNTQLNTAIKTAQSLPLQPMTNTATVLGTPSPTAPPPVSVVTNQQGTLPVVGLSGGLAFVELPAAGGGAAASTRNAGTTGATGTVGATGTTSSTGATGSNDAGDSADGTSGAGLPPDLGGRDPQGFMNVFVVAGGVKLPGEASADDAERPVLQSN